MVLRVILLFFSLLTAPVLSADTLVSESAKKLAAAAQERTQHVVYYDGSYRRLGYPNGDVPDNIGVCTDVIIRSYRTALNIDLQQLVHEDMLAHFAVYPQLWHLQRPDPNIDHRRVPNLVTFFARHGEVLAITDDAADYQAGDIVVWRLDNGLPHIGIISARREVGVPLVVHNIGRGPELAKALFAFTITGHFRYKT